MRILQSFAKPVSIATLLVAALAMTTACSKKAEPISEKHEGTLTDDDNRREEDNSPEDEYKISVKAGANVNVTMTSDEFDTYLLIAKPDGSEAGQNDDCKADPADGSCLTFTAPVSGTYTIYANTADADGRGAYVLNIDVTYPAK